ncbi:MAG: hypothetical protein JNG90_18750 [Planctomycetaceae bacterium]|nr:hypothetical protein [Planctomycetaceae bacterium]
MDLAAIRTAGAKLQPLAAAKRPAGPSDWLANHRESGQTFDHYRATDPNRPTRQLTTIYIQPLGAFSAAEQKLLDRAAELLRVFYRLPVKSLEPIALAELPARARRKQPSVGNEQILTTYVLNELLPARRPRDAVALLALTAVDLWPGEGWNFVFGQGALRERVGVYSLARYGDPAEDDAAYQLALRRTLKVACHETGHMLGIVHCTASECGMNGSNTIDELDRNQLGFCPACEQKVWWACHLDPRQRYAGLIEFARANQLADELRLWEASSRLLIAK